MSDPSRMSKLELARQARQHLGNLKLAGAEWLPKASITTAPLGLGLKEEVASAKPQVLDGPQAVASGQLPVVTKDKSESVFASHSLFGDASGPEPAADVKPAKSGISIEQRKQELKVLIDKVCQCA